MIEQIVFYSLFLQFVLYMFDLHFTYFTWESNDFGIVLNLHR